MIPIARPWFGPEEEVEVLAAIRERWVGQGPRVERFEQELARICGTRHAVAVSSGTAALHLGMLALGVGPGDSVLVPSYTFVATAHTVKMTGARPVLVDCDPHTFDVDPAALAKALDEHHPKAVILVHQFGLPCPMDEVVPMIRDHGALVVEDAACAIGALYNGRPVGGLGEVGCLSFHPRKTVTTGEGGAILLQDQGLDGLVRSLRSHGIDPGATTGGDLPDVARLGFNLRMSDLQAALGIAQLGRLDEMLERRAAVASAYAERLDGLPWLRLPRVPDGVVHGWQSYVVSVTGMGLEAGHVFREELRSRLQRAGVATRPGATAVHTLGYYAREQGLSPEDLPGALEADRLAFAIPLYPEMTPEDVRLVCDTLIREGERLLDHR